jgi:hypothetical protein
MLGGLEEKNLLEREDKSLYSLEMHDRETL